MNKRESLEKSVDQLIDQLFFKKSDEVAGMPEPKQATGENPQTPEKAKKVRTADEGEQPEQPENEEDGKNGRPKDPSNQDHRDADGASALNYPESVSSPASEPAHETTVAKSEKIEISKEDFELLAKAKAEREEKALKKAREEQATLIKSVVLEATKEIRKENADLRKSLDETQNMLKKALSRPVQQKSVSSVQALEKSFGKNDPSAQHEPETFSKSEMLDAAERLVMRKELPDVALIELEDTGSVINPEYRSAIERELTRKR